MFSTKSIHSVVLNTFDPGVPFAKTVFGAGARHPRSGAPLALGQTESTAHRARRPGSAIRVARSLTGSGAAARVSVHGES
jgi:hypothetical protein